MKYFTPSLVDRVDSSTIRPSFSTLTLSRTLIYIFQKSRIRTDYSH